MASTGVTRGRELTFGEGDVLLGLADDVHRVHLQARQRIRATEGGREVVTASEFGRQFGLLGQSGIEGLGLGRAVRRVQIRR